MSSRKHIPDDVLLDWLARRAAGENVREIAPDTFDSCREITNRIRRDDLKMSGDPRDEVEGAYW